MGERVLRSVCLIFDSYHIYNGLRVVAAFFWMLFEIQRLVDADIFFVAWVHIERILFVCVPRSR